MWDDFRTVFYAIPIHSIKKSFVAIALLSNEQFFQSINFNTNDIIGIQNLVETVLSCRVKLPSMKEVFGACCMPLALSADDSFVLVKFA